MFLIQHAYWTESMFDKNVYIPTSGVYDRCNGPNSWPIYDASVKFSKENNIKYKSWKESHSEKFGIQSYGNF